MVGGRPRASLIPERCEQSLWSCPGFLGNNGCCRCFSTFPLQDIVRPHLERVPHARLLAYVKHPKNTEAGITPDEALYIRPSLTQSFHEITQVVFHSRCRVRATKQQAQHHDLVVLGAGNNPRLILVLVVASVEQNQLLVAVRRVVASVNVEYELSRRFIERCHELIDKQLLKPKP